MKSLQIIWGTFVAATFVYLVLGFFVLRGANSAPALAQTMAPIFMGLSVVLTAIIFMIKRLRLIKTYQGYVIIRCALAEAIAIYGLAGRFLGMPPTFFLLLWAWGLVLLLFVVRPSEADQDDYKNITGA